MPWIYVPYELINAWEDWVGSGGEFLESFVEPVFSLEEQEAMRTFHAIWDVASDEVSDDYPPLEKLFGTPPWERLKQAAQDALKAFEERGKLPDDEKAFA